MELLGSLQKPNLPISALDHLPASLPGLHAPAFSHLSCVVIGTMINDAVFWKKFFFFPLTSITMCRYSSHPQIDPLDPLGSGNYCQHLCSPLQEASQKCWLPPTPLLTFFRELESPIWFGFTFQIYPSIWLVLTISTPASWGFCLNYCHSLLTVLHASNLTPCCLSQGSNQHDLCNMEVRL